VNSLSFCKNVSCLTLQLGVSQILHNDLEALEGYFLHKRPLLSLGLEYFVSVITSLPRLKRLNLTFKTTGRISSPPLLSQQANFLGFAMSGTREIMLWLELKERLQANDVHDRRAASDDAKKLRGELQVWVQFPHFTTRGEGDDMLDFGKWIEWRERTLPREVLAGGGEGEVVGGGQTLVWGLGRTLRGAFSCGV
jgi:hypothetical protein